MRLHDAGVDQAIDRSAEAIAHAEAMVITAGAGMGVDSGLPDFRGVQGFWNAYPLYARLGLRFEEAANPVHFERDPAFGWGFYGHRLDLYRRTTPHDGFRILRRWIDRFHLASFVVTSNVDGHFQKAGLAEDRVYEIHGSVHHLQCSNSCATVWENREEVPVDLTTMRATHIPRCACGTVARPNILMFGDGGWISDRSDAQADRFRAFRGALGRSRVVVIELGAGTSIPSIRLVSQRLGDAGARVIRVNPREPIVAPPHISIALGALEALQRIDEALGATA